MQMGAWVENDLIFLELAEFFGHLTQNATNYALRVFAGFCLWVSGCLNPAVIMAQEPASHVPNLIAVSAGY